MEKAWNPELQIFGQAYEDKDVLDSSLMIMPLVFFSTPSDPRFLGTLKKVLLTPERGGLTSNVSSADICETVRTRLIGLIGVGLSV